jgi:hypothetical protein
LIAGWVTVCVVTCAAVCPVAHAQVSQAPIGGKAIPLGDAVVACAPVDGRVVEGGGHALQPPTTGEAVGRAFDVRVAPILEACSSSSASVTVLATEPWPVFDPAASVFAPDDNRLDLKGRNLGGVSVAWRSGSASGVDVCRDAKAEAGSERCAFLVGGGAALARPLRADLRLEHLDRQRRRESLSRFSALAVRHGRLTAVPRMAVMRA